MVTQAAPEPLLRSWLVFFGPDAGVHWWARFLKPGFRHVEAVAWYADQERWVHVAPTGYGLTVTLRRVDEFDGRLGQLATDSSLVLRVRGQRSRSTMPLMSGYCVGTIKALLGVRTCVVTPWGLARYLLANGAEIVTVPDAAIAPEGRPEAEGAPRGGAAPV